MIRKPSTSWPFPMLTGPLILLCNVVSFAQMLPPCLYHTDSALNAKYEKLFDLGNPYADGDSALFWFELSEPGQKEFVQKWSGERAARIRTSTGPSLVNSDKRMAAFVQISAKIQKGDRAGFDKFFREAMQLRKDLGVVHCGLIGFSLMSGGR